MESTLAASTPPWQDVPYSSSSHGWISHHFSPLTSSSPLTFHPTDWRFEENGFGLFLLQCIVILTFCNAFGYAFQRLLGQPRVVGDLLAGVVIGPTALGNVPNFSHTVFPAIQTPLLNLVAQTGLVVFLFLVGLETDTELMLAHWHSVVLITVPPFALTFGVAVGIARLFWDELTDGAQPFTTFFVFVGTVMAVTSLSVLSRVLSEMGILATKMGAMAIAAGAGNDTLGYCLLAVASALAGGGKQIFALYQLLAFVAWLLFLVFIWRPLLFRWLAAAGVNNMSPSSTDHVPRILIVAGVLGGLVSSCVSDMFGLHTLVGAFFYGVAIPHGRYAVAITEAVETPVTLLLLPLYFGTVGLKIDFKTLNNGTVWGLIVLLIVVIFLVKGASTTLCAKLSGLQWRQAMCVGALMQSKGVIEVVIGAIALEAGVIDVQIFSALFLVFLATTSLVRPLARAIYLGQAEREQAMDGKQQGEEGRDDEDHDAEKGSIPDKLHGDNKGAATHSPTSRYPITAAVASVNPNVESLMTLINALAATTTPTTASLCLDIIRAVPTEFGFTEVLRAVSSSAAVSYTTHATSGTTAAGTARSYAHHDALLEALRAQAHLCNVPATISSREPEDDRDNGFLAVEASHILPEILAAHRRAQLRIGCPSRHQGIVICPWEGVSSAPDAGAEGNGTMSHSDSTGWLRTLAASAWGGHHHKAPADDDDAGDDHNSWYGSGAALPARLFTQRNVTTGVLIDGGGGGASARSSTSRNATSSSDIAQHVATLAESRLRERARRQRLPRLIIPFFGGVDDRAAVDFAKRAAAVARGGLVDVIVVLVDAAAALEQSADGQASGGISASSSAEVQEVLRAVGASTHESGTGADVTVDIQVADHAEQRKRDARFLFGPIEEEGTTDSEVVGDMAGEKPSSPPSSPSPSGLVTEVGPERLLYVTLPHSTPLYSVIETSLLLGTSSSDLILVGRGKHASRPATFRRDVVGEATRRLADGEEGTRMLSKAMGRTLGAAAEGVLLARRAIQNPLDYITMPPKAAGVPAAIPADAAGLKNSAGAQAAASQNTAEEKRAVKVEGAKLLESADQEAAQELVNLVKVDGPGAFADCKLQEVIIKGLGEKKNAAAREGACTLVRKLCDQGVGHDLEPYVVGDVFNAIVEAMGDKEKAVQTAARDALSAFCKSMSGWIVPQVLKVILEQARTAGKWQVKTGCVHLLEVLVQSAPDRMAALMPEIIPVMSEVIWDTKTDVQKASRAALVKLCALVSNKDIEKFIPALIQSLIHPVEEVPKTIQVLAATTFVQEVDSPTLALIAPLLIRGINERPTATKRKVAVIADNMTKLVDNERTVRPFLPKLLPGLLKMESAMADPEARSVVQRAIATLRSVGQVEGDGSDVKPLDDVDVKQTTELVTKEISAQKLAGPKELVNYIGQLSTNLANARNFEATEWDSTLIPFITLLRGADAEKANKVTRALLGALARSTGEEAEVFEDEEEGEDLCNCQFSLAYGAKILLNTATLRLKRGHRYGLCGRNGSGKSTLMRAIQNGQVEGFPSPDEVRTWYVEHDLDGSEGDISILDFIVADKRLNTEHKEASKTLLEMGFDEAKQAGPIAALSGGWKMKLALARAVLFKADILLLDEPTNHLDVVNVAWITNYLQTQTQTTSIIVSHDSNFLNNVCTDILHLNRFKIKRYPGNLDAFVKRVPEAKAYAELNTGEDYSFKLPDPPLLDGVKTKEKSLAKMRDVHFQYPGSPAPQLNGVTMQLSLSSRVAVLGPNGAGKSTLIKLVVGDTEPNSGEVWKHPNLVIGYVAQHAFHHIDQHLDKTPLDYMLWRYQTGEDLEEHLKSSRELSEAEKEAMKNGSVFVDESGVKRIIDELVGRKKLKNSFQYEVSFKNYSSADNIWLSRDELIKRGFEKKVLALDSREAQRLGMNRPLVRKEIEKHFNDFGLEAEFTSHNTMRGLSGGQKVKVVLAAATWRRPHIIILDEPTNFLDRESLAALIAALKHYEGGVAIITHSQEFSENVCSEIWRMEGGRLHASGHNWVEGQGSGERLQAKEDEEDKFDAMGNKIEKAKVAEKKSKREERKARMAKKKAGKADDDDDLDL